jgi:spore germination protein YaaH
LSITAVILLASVLIVQVIQPEPAMALAQSGRAGKYMVATSQLDDTAELLMVFNTDVGQMNVYGFNVQASQLELLQQVDIGQLTQRMQEVRERLSRQGGR